MSTAQLIGEVNIKMLQLFPLKDSLILLNMNSSYWYLHCISLSDGCMDDIHAQITRISRIQRRL